jgi:hypothetical protein
MPPAPKEVFSIKPDIQIHAEKYFVRSMTFSICPTSLFNAEEIIFIHRDKS